MTSKHKSTAAIALAAVAAVAVYYYFVDPESTPSPRCMFRLLTDYDCPGCGSQRALHALMHGRVAEAWSHNAAMFFAVPLAAAYAVAGRLPAGAARLLRSPAFIFAIAAAIAAWWIGRNIATSFF